jgi:hypothetical protein
LVFVRSRPAKVGHDAVAYEICDVTAVSGHDAGNCILIASKELPEIFRV